jgi:hypothetical protein
LLEDRDVADGGKKKNACSDLDGIAAKDVVHRGFAVEHDLADFHKSFTKYGMLNVSLGFFTPIDAIEL